MEFGAPDSQFLIGESWPLKEGREMEDEVAEMLKKMLKSAKPFVDLVASPRGCLG